MQSLDFFTPVVNDPTMFGRIAAANSLSDIYAMGATPVTALSVVAFPTCSLGTDVLAAVLKGGAEKVLEAGAVVVGGHTVEDQEPKYGLAVTGLADPAKLVTTQGCQPGDQLILTKPLGTGILTTALKGEVLLESELQEAINGMAMLNKEASRIMIEVGVSACTDITGFGLAGHALEMAEASEVCLELEGNALPHYPRALEMAEIGLIPEGSYRNRDHYMPRVAPGSEISQLALDLLTDPQTSGGLLIAVKPDKAALLKERLLGAGCGAWKIGEATRGAKGTLKVR